MSVSDPRAMPYTDRLCARDYECALCGEFVESWYSREYAPTVFEYSLLPIRFPWVLRKLWFAQDSVAFFLRRKI